MRLTAIFRQLTGKHYDKFMQYSEFSPTPLSLKKLAMFGEEGSVRKSATFLCDELPTRLANIMQEVLLLPKALLATPSASEVREWYERSFCELLEFSKAEWTDDSLDKFKKTLDIIRNRHANTVEKMAMGVMEFKSEQEMKRTTDNELQYFLNRFYMMRISIRMLVNQHLLVFGSELDEKRRFVGSIDPACDVIEILQDAYDDARYLCEHYYMTAPTLDIELCGASDNNKIEFVYVPSHLYHILFELMKNALRAVVEFHRESDSLPPVKILIAAGQESVTIRISDRGGGIPRSEMDYIFDYTYTTAASRKSEVGSTDQSFKFDSNAPLAGYGYGLPLSRLYARYFNGDLSLTSIEGYGSDALVYLKRNAGDADERLPVFNRTSARQYGSSSIPIADWSNPQFSNGWRSS